MFLIEQFPLILQHIHTAAALIGIIGNVLTFMVFRRKRLRNSSYSIYFRAMAVLDSIVFLHMLRYWLASILQFDLNLVSVFLCKTNEYQLYVSGLSSLWIITVILVDRFVNIIYHNYSMLFKHKWFQLTLVGLVLIYACLIHSSIPISYRLEETRLNESRRCVLPFALFKLNASIALANIALNSLINTILYVKLIVFVKHSRSRITSRTNVMLAKDLKFAISTVVMTVLNFMCKMPFGLGIVISIKLNLTPEQLMNVVYVVFTIAVFCDASRFFVNLGFNSIFKEEFIKMCRRTKS